MIAKLMRRDGGTITLKPPIIFEGGEAQPGVVASFQVNGREVSGRVVTVSTHLPNEPPDGDVEVTIEPINQDALDLESEVTLASLPPRETLNLKP